MNSFIFKALLILNILIVVGCDQNLLNGVKKSTIDDLFNEKLIPPKNNDTTGKNGLSITQPLPLINSINASNYNIQGYCDPSKGNVEIRIGFPLVSAVVPCNNVK